MIRDDAAEQAVPGTAGMARHQSWAASRSSSGPDVSAHSLGSPALRLALVFVVGEAFAA
ncbi:hypothetical protein ACF1DV_22060 [Streptomyces achromogenes]|uniref:hypothetical protein n=1 Tax=Streptomyces achromogenes TaxID=67255 RepID=UPI0036F7738D